jgi:hypothetical protein
MARDLDRLVDAGDRAYVAQIADPAQREIVLASLLRHRAPEALAVGDPVPGVTATRLEPRGRVSLDELVAGRPALLVFGSYT